MNIVDNIFSQFEGFDILIEQNIVSKRTSKCSNCHQKGHNKRTCGKISQKKKRKRKPAKELCAWCAWCVSMHSVNEECWVRKRFREFDELEAFEIAEKKIEKKSKTKSSF